MFALQNHIIHFGRLAASAVAMAAAAGIVAVYIGELDDFNFYEIIYYMKWKQIYSERDAKNVFFYILELLS